MEKAEYFKYKNKLGGCIVIISQDRWVDICF